ncbi:MAG: glycosyltransferase family 4 protein [Planctomycetaceae bacterium]|nr:glycosyltransferase family 4 protein [Planctomycetota bacterium]NUN53758.1 glycosyltransferase family 4 protein [Planctomycetaceae bacterium]
MRLLYVQQHFATGRGEAGVRGYNLVRTLVARGHDVTVVSGHNWRDRSTAAGKGRLVDETETEGFRIVRIGVPYSNHMSFPARVGSFLSWALLASWVVLRRPADLVFASSTPLTVSIPALAARFLRGLPYAFEVRDLWPDLAVEMGVVRNGLLRWFLYRWERIAYRRASWLVALAPGIADGIVAKAGIPRERVAMIPNGCDTVGILPLPGRPRRHLGVPDDAFVLGFTGTHGPANGLPAVLDAAAELKRRGRTGILLVLVGDGRDKAALVERARREGLDNVRFLGLFGKDRYAEVLAEFDVGMQILKNVPGFRWGTSPNKFFDYLAAGRPVLVNYPGWMASIVEEGGCGVAVPPDDPAAFADAVERLAAGRDRLPAMGAAARRVAEERFAQVRILSDLAEFLERGMAARVRPPGKRP